MAKLMRVEVLRDRAMENWLQREALKEYYVYGYIPQANCRLSMLDIQVRLILYSSALMTDR